MDKEKDKLDAGLRSLDHCERTPVLGVARRKYSSLFVLAQFGTRFQHSASNENIPTDKNKLPRWRYHLREQLLPLIRWETPYLAWFQANLRSPALDSYFAISANLGTHTFFMIMLPILFWCGYTSLGRGYVLSRSQLSWWTCFARTFFGFTLRA